MSATVRPWGVSPDGAEVHRIELASSQVRLGLLTWGATVQSLTAPDRDGAPGEVVLGFDTLEEYAADQPYLGATVGRYANRIAHGRFALDGEKFQVPTNDGPHALHGGPEGFWRRIWTLESLEETAEGGTADLSLVSADGDMGFPGTLRVRLRVEVRGGVVRMEARAVTDAATVVNLTNHAYFDLAGSPDPATDHVLTIPADHYLPVDAGAIPLPGDPAPVAGTAFDLRSPGVLAERLAAPGAPVDGFDHTWVLAESPGWHPAAVLDHPASGRRLTVRTTEPGVQFYSGNFLDGTLRGRGGTPIPRRGGLCLETQHFPDSPNRPDYPSTLLRPGEEYRTVTEWEFGTC